MNQSSIQGLKIFNVHHVPLTVLFEYRLHPQANVKSGKIHLPQEMSDSRICAIEPDHPLGEWDEGWDLQLFSFTLVGLLPGRAFFLHGLIHHGVEIFSHIFPQLFPHAFHPAGHAGWVFLVDISELAWVCQGLQPALLRTNPGHPGDEFDHPPALASLTFWVKGDSQAQNDEAGNFSAILTEIFIDGH
jgi:hypothetical protein